MLSTNKTFLLPLSLIVLFSLVSTAIGLTADLGDKRYFIITNQKYNWFAANHACTSKGMALASIESETEYQNLRKYLFEQERVGDGFWLCGNNLGESTNTNYNWLSTGNALNFQKWAKDATDGADKCIQTDASFTWKKEDCTTGSAYAICSRPLIPDCGIIGGCKIDPSFFF